MSNTDAESPPVNDDPVDKVENDLDRKNPQGEDREIHWKVVAKTAGIASATIIADRLRTEGIPARAWQEGAGQAFGLTVGLLGTGHVVVPEENLAEAEKILSEPWDSDEIDEYTNELEESKLEDND